VRNIAADRFHKIVLPSRALDEDAALRELSDRSFVDFKNMGENFCRHSWRQHLSNRRRLIPAGIVARSAWIRLRNGTPLEILKNREISNWRVTRSGKISPGPLCGPLAAIACGARAIPVRRDSGVLTRRCTRLGFEKFGQWPPFQKPRG
jgi:hypothetical protein